MHLYNAILCFNILNMHIFEEYNHVQVPNKTTSPFYKKL